MKNSEENIIKIAKALSDKTRIRILKEINKRGTITCGEAGDIAELSQPTCSHHLKILSDAGILHTKKNGRHIILSINKPALNDFASLISDTVKK